METIEGSIAVNPYRAGKPPDEPFDGFYVMEILTLNYAAPRVFKLLGVDSGRSVADAAMDEISLRTAAALTARRETAGRPGS